MIPRANRKDSYQIRHKHISGFISLPGVEGDSPWICTATVSFTENNIRMNGAEENGIHRKKSCVAANFCLPHRAYQSAVPPSPFYAYTSLLKRSVDERTCGHYSTGLDVFGITGGERTRQKNVFAERRADTGAACGGVSRQVLDKVLPPHPPPTSLASPHCHGLPSN
ncbi:hypothetical protein Q8A73_017765 [Channa argus]|nr:hypothetical protein Q8A73_017765 [Channa argus]